MDAGRNKEEVIHRDEGHSLLEGSAEGTRTEDRVRRSGSGSRGKVNWSKGFIVQGVTSVTGRVAIKALFRTVTILFPSDHFHRLSALSPRLIASSRALIYFLMAVDETPVFHAHFLLAGIFMPIKKLCRI